MMLFSFNLEAYNFWLKPNLHMVAQKLTQLKRAILAGMLFLFSVSLFAQDIHFSQFRNAPIVLNPALTGVFEGNHRIMANYRSQWNNVPVGWSTLYGVFDTKVLRSASGNSFFGLGGILDFDESGDSQMGTLNLALSGSFTHQLTPAHWLTAGAQFGGTQRSFKTERLRFDEQYIGDSFDPQSGSQEDFSDRSVFWADFGAGGNWHYQKVGSRSRMNVGLAGHHLNNPVKSFWGEDEVRLATRVTWYGMASIQATQLFDIILNATGSYQTPYTEHMLGLGGRIHLSQRATKQLAVAMGVNYRFNGEGFSVGDAIFPFIEVDYQSWRVGLSYDINTSDFTNASAGNGGPELSLRYIFKSVGPADYCPTCPTYL